MSETTRKGSGSLNPYRCNFCQHQATNQQGNRHWLSLHFPAWKSQRGGIPEKNNNMGNTGTPQSLLFRIHPVFIVERYFAGISWEYHGSMRNFLWYLIYLDFATKIARIVPKMGNTGIPPKKHRRMVIKCERKVHHIHAAKQLHPAD